MTTPGNMPEVWVGAECTVNRVHADVYDQLKATGHDRRLDDLRRLSALGVKTIRFPAVWERAVAHVGAPPDWRWLDQRIEAAERLGLRLIAGLLHHGGGPPGTDLLHRDFAALFADFAGVFAARYPHIAWYTPVNEPLTTARFAALYGLWYPHARADGSFLRSVFNQCRAVCAAMEAIRAARGPAQLVQTEDIGRTFSTPQLAYQADFENDRRWFSLDLLTGRFGEGHPLWQFCLASGLSESELRDAAAARCLPAVIGINHYVTSNRFLDERTERYPVSCHGGNGRHRYADVEAVRVGAENCAGPASIIREVWQRYGTPIAVTEAHLACTREEQIRWLYEIWTAACGAVAGGIDVRAVTAWSVFGAYDWDSLLTQRRRHYECGAFDVRSTPPRPTLLARMIQGLAQQRDFTHPVLDQPGWWHRPERLLYPSIPLNGADELTPPWLPREPRATSRPLLITGYPGNLARTLAQACRTRGLTYCTVGRLDGDLSEPKYVAALLQGLQPWAVAHAAGSRRGRQRAGAWLQRDDVEAPSVVASACAIHATALLTFSSDAVFDGDSGQAYTEDSPLSPNSPLGEAQCEGQRLVLERWPRALVVRSGPFFGALDEDHFLARGLRGLATEATPHVVDNSACSPTYLPDLANAALDLLLDGEQGVWHLFNPGGSSEHALITAAAEKLGLDTKALQAQALRIGRTTLASVRGVLLPCLDGALHRYLHERRLCLADYRPDFIREKVAP